VVESVKAVSDLFAPISGRVKIVNQSVIEHPEMINHDPYGKGWLIVIESLDETEKTSLLDAEQYQKLLDKEAK
jgi:glycine cleavage system H protein